MEQQHSRLGIAAFVISIIAGLLLFAASAYTLYLALTSPGALQESASPRIIGLGLTFIGLFLVELVAVGLGIAGALQTERKKSLAILGCVFSSFAILCFVGAVAYGHSLP